MKLTADLLSLVLWGSPPVFECPSLQGVRDDFPSLFAGLTGTHEQMMQLFATKFN